MPRDRLIITLAEREERLAIPSLVTALENTVGILSEIDCDVSSKTTATLQWYIVAMKMESPLVAVLEAVATLQEGEVEPEVIRPFLVGMRQIERGASRPKHFTTEALIRAKRIAALRENGVEYIEYAAANQNPVRPTQHLAANVDELLGTRPPYSVMTELEGRLESISVHGRTPDFRIYDPITNQSIRCFFQEDDLGLAADLIKRRARVRVLGKARYNEKDQPISVEVERFTALPEQSELPQIADLHKANIDITGGQDSVDYVRGLRDAK